MLGWDAIGNRWVDLTATLRDGAPVTGPGDENETDPWERYTRMVVAPDEETDLTHNDHLALNTVKDSPLDADDTAHPIQDRDWIPQSVR